MLELERITARRNELDTLDKELANQLAEVQAEREELVIAEPVPPPGPPSGRRPGWRDGRFC
ncbi:hypothetical protein [Streptomyces sp. NPDC056987]|uniref:hypothetical protein n=1 Tax=Streptomyces sp. NPDC056987 TaxID=3345988 RepID=UPI00362E2C54